MFLDAKVPPNDDGVWLGRAVIANALRNRELVYWPRLPDRREPAFDDGAIPMLYQLPILYAVSNVKTS